jgi:hypothetical protein
LAPLVLADRRRDCPRIDDIEIAEQLGRSSGCPLTASIRQFVPHSYQKTA